MKELSKIQVNFSGRGLKYTKEEEAVVLEAMRSADPLTQGAYQQKFEASFAEYLGAENCFAVATATAALEMSAQLCELGADDEVIIPAHTYTSSAYPFAKQGAKIVWADIDFDTRVASAAQFEACITSKTKVLVVVHLYGYAVDMKEIMALAKKHDLLVVEDVAQAIGAELEKQKVGSFGHFAAFSFHSHKNISTLGEGGILRVASKELAKITPALRHNGHFPYPANQREHYWQPAMSDVDVPFAEMWPNNFCLGEVQCALGEKLLERVDTIAAQRRSAALNFIDALTEYPQFSFHREDSLRHAYHLLPAFFDETQSAASRDDYLAFLAYEKGIKCVVQYCPLNRYPLYEKFGFGEANCPNTDRFYDNMISFPFHHWLSDSDRSYIIESIKEACEKLG